MNIFKSLLASAAVAVMASSAGAATLTGGAFYELPSNFSGNAQTTAVGVGVGTSVVRGATITVDPTKTWQLTSLKFMGREAGYVNFFNIEGTDYFNPQPALGTVLDLTLLPTPVTFGLGGNSGDTVDFTFKTVNPASSVSSGAPLGFHPGYALRDITASVVGSLDDKVFLALFNDKSTSDKDYDDFMVAIGLSDITDTSGGENPSPIPLPAAAWLLLSGLGAIGATRALKGKKTA